MTKEPVTWSVALEAVRELNRHDDRRWRLPNINELESLVDCALPRQAPFDDVQDAFVFHHLLFETD